MADMETWYFERMNRDNCNIEASIQYINGKPANLIMRGDGCTAKLSTTTGNVLEFADEYEVCDTGHGLQTGGALLALNPFDQQRR